MELNVTAVTLFVVFVGFTLFITWRAARYSKSASDFYAAGSRISGLVNGVAISGDFMSAATFLGIVGLIYTSGFDGLIYILSPMVGLAIVMFSMAGPFRNLGKFTLSDVVAFRLEELPIRTFCAICSLVIVVLYLIAQFVGAGKLVQLLFGVDYSTAVIAAGVLTMTYVAVGGMLATTWIQVTKAVMMISAITFMSIMIMSSFGFSFIELYDGVAMTHRLGASVLGPGAYLKDPFSIFSLAMALTLGFAGLPHVLMRLFTVPDARQANISVIYATACIGSAFAMVFFVIGFGAIVLLPQYPEFYDASGKLLGGNNMVSIHLSRVIGGDVFFGVISVVAFATILAVVAGLILAGASAVSHDLYANGLFKGKVSESAEVRITRIATVVLGISGIMLALAFEDQNIAYMISMVLCVSGSTNFPILILSLYWRGLTTRGAILGGLAGLSLSVGLIIVGPTIWVEILGNGNALFPYKYPALVSVPAAFIGMWLFSILDGSDRARKEKDKFDQQFSIAFEQAGK